MNPAAPEPLLNTCPSCREVIDVSGVRPYEKIACPLCDDTIRVRTKFHHFTLKKEIGSGGMSRVFRAIDDNLGREVALKILHSQFEDKPELAAQFEREAKLTATVNHPNVVQVYSAGHDQGYFYIAMELLESSSVETLIETRKRIPVPDALRIIHEVALGLQAAHQQGLIHRDIKPGNILFDPNGAARLVDFGLELAQGSDDESSEIWATPFYVPPEKLWGRQEDFRSDIFSLGATLFHMIAGQPPHAANTDSIEELIKVKSEPADLKTVAPQTPADVIQLVARMMAYDPPGRQNSYDELLQDISNARKRFEPKDRGATVGLVVGITVLVAALAAVIVMLWPEQTTSTTIPTPNRSSQGSGELVVSAQDAMLAETLAKARKAWSAGRSSEAVGLLSELAKNEKARSDWRAWASFELGLMRYLQGEKAAWQSFKEAETHSLMLDRATKDFFSETAAPLQQKET
ncbi:MAG: serine/threonine-protein kinase, partial [Verrucomicrobiota bacterium]